MSQCVKQLIIIIIILLSTNNKAMKHISCAMENWPRGSVVNLSQSSQTLPVDCNCWAQLAFTHNHVIIITTTTTIIIIIMDGSIDRYLLVFQIQPQWMKWYDAPQAKRQHQQNISNQRNNQTIQYKKPKHKIILYWALSVYRVFVHTQCRLTIFPHHLHIIILIIITIVIITDLGSVLTWSSGCHKVAQLL